MSGHHVIEGIPETSEVHPSGGAFSARAAESAAVSYGTGAEALTLPVDVSAFSGYVFFSSFRDIVSIHGYSLQCCDSRPDLLYGSL